MCLCILISWRMYQLVIAMWEIISILNVLNNSELLMNLWVSCAVYWSGPNLADLGYICSYVCSQLGDRRESSYGLAGSDGLSWISWEDWGLSPQGLLSSSRLVWTCSRAVAGFWERQRNCERLLKSWGLELPPATPTTFYGQKSQETRINSKGRESRRSPLAFPPIRVSCKVTLRRGVGKRKNKGLWPFL